jgi:polyferredoxin
MSDSRAETKAPEQRIERNRAKPIQRYRFLIQVAFALLCLWIGIEFHYFVKGLEAGNLANLPSRPPGVEGFLPISSLMSLYYFFLTGLVHPAHPAGLFILVAIILLSVAFGKSFCSWLCPVGFINELLGTIHDKIFKRRLALPPWLDWPLRSLKYLLLLFFVWAIFVKMSALALEAFLNTPYNVMADVKMYYFFADISKLALIVLVALFVLSILIRNFWCRFLCPYGALLGLTSLLSPTKIKRDPVKCIDCGKCAKACPSHIKVDKVLTVISDECHSCMNCVDVCPIADTLNLKLVGTKKKIDKRLVAVGIVGLFLLVTGLGLASGNWHNGIKPEQYIRLQDEVQMMGHPTGSRDIEQLNRAVERPAPSETIPSN